MNELLGKLKKQITKIDHLRTVEPWSAEFQLWEKSTERLIEQLFGADGVKLFKGQQTVTFSYIEDDFNDRQYAKELNGREKIMEGLIEEMEESFPQQNGKLLGADVLKEIWKNETALKENLLKTVEVRELYDSLQKHIEQTMSASSLPGLRFRKLVAEKRNDSWWTDSNGFPSQNSWERLRPFLEILEQHEAEKTIKHRLETEGLFVESRSQGEDQHLLIGVRDGTGQKAHIIIDGKSGEIRTEDNRKEATELATHIETILTLPNGKRIRSTREAIEEI